jgi:Putative Actinobacterial Holin-X, holin superfamily III
MPNNIVALAQQYAQQKAQNAVKQIAVPAAFGLVAAVLFLFVVIALFAALFFWLMSLYGPTTAALIVAAVALVLGLTALLPVVAGRRAAPEPPPAPSPTMPQFASLLAQTAPSLALKRPLLTTVLLAVALGMTARNASTNKK